MVVVLVQLLRAQILQAVRVLRLSGVPNKHITLVVRTWGLCGVIMQAPIEC